MERVNLCMANRLFPRAKVDEFERILTDLPSGHPDKMRLVKEVIEPAKVKQLNFYDPHFNNEVRNVGHWAVNIPDIIRWWSDDDIILTRPSGRQEEVESKTQIITFYDRVNQKIAGVDDYCCLSKRQIDRYMKQPNKIILMERLISNFDRRTTTGAKNCDAYLNWAKKEPVQSWDYLIIHTDDIKQWRRGKDYGIGLVKSNNDQLFVFNRNNVRRRIDLKKHLDFAAKRGIILSVYFKHEGIHYKDLDISGW